MYFQNDKDLVHSKYRTRIKNRATANQVCFCSHRLYHLLKPRMKTSTYVWWRSFYYNFSSLYSIGSETFIFIGVRLCITNFIVNPSRIFHFMLYNSQLTSYIFSSLLFLSTTGNEPSVMWGTAQILIRHSGFPLYLPKRPSPAVVSVWS